MFSISLNIEICLCRYCRIISCYDCDGTAAHKIWLHCYHVDIKESLDYVTDPSSYDYGNANFFKNKLCSTLKIGQYCYMILMHIF